MQKLKLYTPNLLFVIPITSIHIVPMRVFMQFELGVLKIDKHQFPLLIDSDMVSVELDLIKLAVCFILAQEVVDCDTMPVHQFQELDSVFTEFGCDHEKSAIWQISKDTHRVKGGFFQISFSSLT